MVKTRVVNVHWSKIRTVLGVMENYGATDVNFTLELATKA